MAKAKEIRSREYKLMLDHVALADRAQAHDQLRRDLGAIAAATRAVKITGKLADEEHRAVVFLDTPERALLHNGLILRRRAAPDGDRPEYTLKCRSDDRLVAVGAALDAGHGFDTRRKLEEDIAPPFRCRFSQSSTIEPPDRDALHARPPRHLAQASRLYPVLASLHHDGLPCPGDRPLAPVDTAFERVYTGATLSFTGGDDTCDATIALIEWSSDATSPPLVAELSFRIKSTDELTLHPALARVVRDFFDQVQRLPWSRPDGTTKTEFAYRPRAA